MADWDYEISDKHAFPNDPHGPSMVVKRIVVNTIPAAIEEREKLAEALLDESDDKLVLIGMLLRLTNQQQRQIDELRRTVGL